MDKKYTFVEDDFELEQFQKEFNETIEQNYMKKNKFKINFLYFVIDFVILVVTVAIAFFLYTVLQNYINML